MWDHGCAGKDAGLGDVGPLQMAAISSPGHTATSSETARGTRESPRSSRAATLAPHPQGASNHRTDTKTMEPDPFMAPIVRMVFETYAREDISLSRL